MAKPKMPAALRGAQNSLNVWRSWVDLDPNERRARTHNARAAALDRFERQVDPDGVLDPVERARRAETAKTMFFREMALKSAKVRAARKSARHATEGEVA